jgi:ribose transport system substrate-binding protein
MKRTNQRWAIAFVVLAAALVASTAGSATEKGTIALMFPNASQPIIVQELGFSYPEAKRRGYKFIVADPGNDLSKQVGTIETWIQEKVDAIVSVAPEPETFEKVAAKARKAGIVWVTYAARLKNEDGVLTWPHFQQGYLIGQEAAKYVNAKLGGKAKVALLTFTPGQWARNRQAGMEAGLKKFAPGAQIVSKQDTLDAPKGLSIISTVLQAHPDLNVVLSVTDTGTEGAYQAFVNAGHAKNDPKVFLAGIDGTPRAFDLIKAGTMYRASAALKLSRIGKAVIDLPADILETKKSQDKIIQPDLLTLRTPKLVDSYIADWTKKKK